MTSLYIKNGKDISGFPLEVLIENQKIAQIGPKLDVTAADEEIDLHNASYVLSLIHISEPTRRS